MAKKKYKFAIGDWVRSDFETQMIDSEAGIRGPKEVQRHIHGQVCGIATRQLGQRVSGSGGGYEGDYDPPYFSVTGVIRLYEVREGMTNKSVLCQERHLCEATADPRGLKLRKVNAYPCDDRYRQQLREAAKDMPRANGRFAKLPKSQPVSV